MGARAWFSYSGGCDPTLMAIKGRGKRRALLARADEVIE
jgi:hypothetical protein